MSDTVNIQINFFGPFLEEEDVDKILDPNFNSLYEIQIDILESFFGLPSSSFSRDILLRYVETTTQDIHMNIVPHSEKILDRLLNPLSCAKINYCLGHYLATIALCGVVGEMLAILLWKINGVKFNGLTITEEQEKSLFGKDFEKMGQEQRLKILRAFGFFEDGQYEDFLKIKNCRRPYLHLWSKENTDEKRDSLNAIKTSLKLFKNITGITIVDSGSISLNQRLLQFLKKQELNS